VSEGSSRTAAGGARSVEKKRVAKAATTIYVCQKCGHQTRKWLGKCPDCGEWNSFVEERARVEPKGAAAARARFTFRDAKPVAYSDIESQDDARVPSGIDEFDRVLGGGIVPGSLVLIGGDAASASPRCSRRWPTRSAGRA